MKRSKRYREIAKKVDRDNTYGLEEGLALAKETATAKFDESIELAVRLGVDPRKADQMVRGTVALPHGTGKSVRVLVLTKGLLAKEAEEAGADYVGFEEYIEKIKSGWTDIDVVVASPDVMAQVGKLGRILGPRGLMPNPKSGTVTMEIGKAVKAVKAGRVEFRVDKFGILHIGVGKASFDIDKLVDNTKTFLETVLRLRPASAKGQYVRSIYITPTMGVGIKLDRNAVLTELR
ncbi:50S ribosomal protein L1 [bacterium BMS3Abin05]|nr:50S ribosomal protein L1 [bacterium BMS3Abin05]GBE28793.1 50S ribosomal protein L1 [bacterium BMS3Bbin03]HDL78645.1 50S ribosomal protein L1 [Bacteroidota bacterium]HDZ12846.1 50S ribosomal protein L1 [Bacteroidota bacterium]